MSERLKEIIKDTKTLIKKSKNFKKVDINSIKLTKIKFIEIEDVQFERKSSSENVGRLRGFRKQTLTLKEISWKEFSDLPEQFSLEYPIKDLIENKEEITNWLKSLNLTEIKLCKSNVRIKDFIDYKSVEKNKKEYDEISKLIQKIQKLTFETEEEEYENNPDLSEELMELTEEFYNKWNEDDN